MNQPLIRPTIPSVFRPRSPRSAGSRAVVALLVLGASLLSSPAPAAVVAISLTPSSGATNQANLSLSQTKPGPAGPVSQTMQVQSTSTLDVSFDTVSRVLTLASATWPGTDMTFTFGTFVHPCLRQNVLTIDTADALYPPRGVVDGAGNFTALVPVHFSGKVGNNCTGDEVQYEKTVDVPMQGTFSYDANSGATSLTNLSSVGNLPAFKFTWSTFEFQLTGTLTANFSGTGLSAADWSALGTQSLAKLGYAVASAGDVNGDGYDDVLVGEPEYVAAGSQRGRVHLFRGSATGLATTPAQVLTEPGGLVGGYFGSALASAGDVNGDGFDDVIVGAFGGESGGGVAGHAYLFLGSASGLGTTSAWTPNLGGAVTGFGFAVASAGDVNGDGYADVLVGTPLGTPRAFLFLGSAAGLGATPAWTATGAVGERFGHAVASAGDVNGDGFDDVVVGVPFYCSNGQTNEASGCWSISARSRGSPRASSGPPSLNGAGWPSARRWRARMSTATATPT
ncbi:MAG: FG-GAP-like repeat-containing protein [bacterium]